MGKTLVILVGKWGHFSNKIVTHNGYFFLLKTCKNLCNSKVFGYLKWSCFFSFVQFTPFGCFLYFKAKIARKDTYTSILDSVLMGKTLPPACRQ